MDATHLQVFLRILGNKLLVGSGQMYSDSNLTNLENLSCHMLSIKGGKNFCDSVQASNDTNEEFKTNILFL